MIAYIIRKELWFEDRSGNGNSLNKPLILEGGRCLYNYKAKLS